MNKTRVAIVRGKFLNQYEMQTIEEISEKYSITAFGSRTSFHSKFKFPVKKLWSPMDLPEFPYKMPILNRACIDAHLLLGLESQLRGFDIAHSAETYYRYTQQCLTAKKKGYVKKVVVTVLENIAHNNEGIWGRKRYKQNTREYADRLIALTEDSKNALIAEGATPEKIVVIGSGVDTKRFKAGITQKKKKLTLLFVGRLEKYKGVFEILEAFQMLLKDKDIKTPLELVIVGMGSEYATMVQKTHAMGIEKYITYKTAAYNNIHKIYQQADILLAPSIDTPTWREQYGYMLLEAQASGLPIVTTDAGSIPEVVGDAALLVQQQQSGELYQAVMLLINDFDKRKQLGKLARVRAEKVHDSKIIAKKIESVYESVL